jgi:hypothetical protein
LPPRRRAGQGRGVLPGRVVSLGYIIPFFGLELLDMARDVAAFNLPARVGHLFGVSL